MSVLERLLQVELSKPDDFLKVKETLTRIGIASEKNKKLYQSCHILHKRGLYYIVHFKELFVLDGRDSTLDDEDIGRRNTIAKLLHDWGLVRLVNPAAVVAPTVPVKMVKILNFTEKDQWELVSKYKIGRK